MSIVDGGDEGAEPLCLAWLLFFFVSRLILASEAYHHAISKKKPCDVLDGAEKMLPVDTLGLVMIVHGEEFREDSIFGAFVNDSVWYDSYTFAFRKCPG